MKAREVFTPGTFPTVTFVDDHIKDKQKILADALDTGSMLIAISGPSKSGKTVFVENVVGKENLLHVTGAGVDTPNKLWERVFDLVGTSTKITTTKESSGSVAISGKAGGGVDFIIAKAKSEVGATGTISKKTSEQESHAFDLLQLLIKEFSGSDFVIFIDDFHYMSVEVQKEISRQIKEAIRNNIKIICASVPYHSDDVLKANADLRGRIVSIDLDYWTPAILAKIAYKGFSVLEIGYRLPFIEELSNEAAGSPQLMQSLCLNACYEAGFREKQPASAVELPIIADFAKNVCCRTVLMADYSSIVDKMREGPKTRGTDRNKYIFTDGTQGDVYEVLLRAISLSPPQLTFRYQNLADRIRGICNGEAPSGSSVIGACGHMSGIANDSANQYIIEWDSDNDVLDIRDPYLLFYLRWSS